LIDPAIITDTDGSGFVPSDASLQINEAGVGFATANLPSPPIPGGVVFQVVGNNVDPRVSIPANLHVAVDGTLRVPVNIDNPHPAGSTGLIEAHLALTYDPEQFAVSMGDVHLGSILAASGDWSLAATVNALTGEIAIALSSSSPITSSAGGSLVIIDFHAISSAASVSSIALVSSINRSGQQVIRTELEDAQGAFTLSPAPDDRLDP
jgi:hypothetical protein